MCEIQERHLEESIERKVESTHHVLLVLVSQTGVVDQDVQWAPMFLGAEDADAEQRNNNKRRFKSQVTPNNTFSINPTQTPDSQLNGFLPIYLAGDVQRIPHGLAPLGRDFLDHLQPAAFHPRQIRDHHPRAMRC